MLRYGSDEHPRVSHPSKDYSNKTSDEHPRVFHPSKDYSNKTSNETRPRTFSLDVSLSLGPLILHVPTHLDSPCLSSSSVHLSP